MLVLAMEFSRDAHARVAALWKRKRNSPLHSVTVEAGKPKNLSDQPAPQPPEHAE